mgnify:CR=1 FL=1
MIYTNSDGGARGNPGPGAIGVLVREDGKILTKYSTFIGKNVTNNIAEYSALIFALQEALMLKLENIKVNTDSQLLYRQLKKIYKIKNPNILGLYNQISQLMPAFKEVTFNHISRDHNRGADKLANLAIKQALKKK